VANASVNDSLFTLSKGRFEVGKIGENDLLQAELALLRSRTTLDGAKLEAERTLAALRIALNMAPDTPIEIIVPSETPFVAVDPELAVAEAVRNGSQSESIELQEVQAKRRVSEAKLSSGFGATVNVGLGFNQSASTFGSAYDSLFQQRELSVGIAMPLVGWGARKADIESARADERRVASTVQSTRATQEHEARFAAMQFTQTQRVVALSAKADTVADKRFEVAKNRYVIGKIGINDLYVAQNEKDNARQGYVTALRGYWVAYYRLRRLTLYDFVEERRLMRD
jgi:outer membrane protein TolC